MRQSAESRVAVRDFNKRKARVYPQTELSCASLVQICTNCSSKYACLCVILIYPVSIEITENTETKQKMMRDKCCKTGDGSVWLANWWC